MFWRPGVWRTERKATVDGKIYILREEIDVCVTVLVFELLQTKLRAVIHLRDVSSKK